MTLYDHKYKQFTHPKRPLRHQMGFRTCAVSSALGSLTGGISRQNQTGIEATLTKSELALRMAFFLLAITRLVGWLVGWSNKQRDKLSN